VSNSRGLGEGERKEGGGGGGSASDDNLERDYTDLQSPRAPLADGWVLLRNIRRITAPSSSASSSCVPPPASTLSYAGAPDKAGGATQVHSATKVDQYNALWDGAGKGTRRRRVYSAEVKEKRGRESTKWRQACESSEVASTDKRRQDIAGEGEGRGEGRGKERKGEGGQESPLAYLVDSLAKSRSRRP